ncbi:MAG: Rid family detoxifying hydrolase [Actinobacteria bacterium]|nr:Rid family detoxifying hydrolase [Actinomycetota bacterium]MCI0542894.1 Rid family detoxifying hydrolase [Actinomycetota bacterium]MCI0679179.1 Rid family detoxifying hydrolase [Actinomycetota bacterium]
MSKTVPSTPSATKPMAPYSVATEANGLIFISGQVAIDPTTGERAPDDIVAQTRRVLDNIGVVLGDVSLGYGDVVKTTIFLADIAHFGAVNEVYATYFDDEPPARTTVQAGALPGGFLIEIEAVVAR